MDPRSFRCADEHATARLGVAIADALRPGDAVLLDGPLGAGKTTLARALLRALSGDPALAVPSPSYTLLQDYETGRGPVAHLDLWRVDRPDALEEIGWREARRGIVLVEWPDRLGVERPDDALRVRLRPDRDGGDGRDALLDGWPDARLAPVIAAASPAAAPGEAPC